MTSRIMRRLGLLVLVSLPLGLPATRADKPPGDDKPPLEPGASIARFAAGERVDAVLEGRLVSYALPRTDDGTRDVLLLVGPAKEPSAMQDEPKTGDDRPDRRGPCDDETLEVLSLWRLQLPACCGSGEPQLSRLRDELPPGLTAIDAIDTDGDGIDELLLIRPGEAYVLRRGSTGAAERVVADPDLRRATLEPRHLLSASAPGASWLEVTAVGEARFYRPAPHGPWTLAASLALPIGAGHAARALRLQSPTPRHVGANDGGGPLYVAFHYRPLDQQRLESLVLRPGEILPEKRTEECWSRLPEREILLHLSTLALDGAPVLLVTTMPAERVSIFGEQQLRIFALRSDRSRAGVRPLVALKTRANNIKSIRPWILDLDDDGREDLVLGHFKGFDDEDVALDVYLQREDGTFPDGPKTTGFGVKKADGSVLEYGRDLTGDDLPDLVLVANDELRLHAGLLSARKGRKIVDKNPLVVLPLGGAVSQRSEKVASIGTGGASQRFEQPTAQPRPIDLDGDGRAEFVFADPGERGHGLISVYRFLPPD